MPSPPFTLHQRSIDRSWPTSWLTAWEERSSSIETATDLPRGEAQRLAYHDVLANPPTDEIGTPEEKSFVDLDAVPDRVDWGEVGSWCLADQLALHRRAEQFEQVYGTDQSLLWAYSEVRADRVRRAGPMTHSHPRETNVQEADPVPESRADGPEEFR